MATRKSKRVQPGTQQLGLWEQPAPVDEPVDDCPPGFERVPPMGGTMQAVRTWADGDTSPDELARLASVLLGRSETRKTCAGEVIWFRTIAARVERDHVAVTLRRIEPLVKPARLMDGRNAKDEEENDA